MRRQRCGHKKSGHNKKNRVGAGVAFLGAAGIACLLAGWNAGGTQVATLSAADVIALRFPDSRYDGWDNVASLPARPPHDDDRLALFDPKPTFAPAVPAVTTVSVTRGEPGPSARVEPSSTAAAPAMQEAVKETAKEPGKAPMKLAAVVAKPAPAPKARPGAVLNDAQIASIKSRLKLTPEQQDMWPAVEAALRELSFERKPDGRRAVAYTGSIDPYSSEVQRLKSAAFPLIMSFSDEQKRELRVIAHVAGLEKLAAQF